MIGRVIDGKYRIERSIGQGAMGAVYEAVDLGMGRHVALKIIHPVGHHSTTDEILKRFQLEGYAIGRLESPYIARVYATGRDAETMLPFMAMELLVGENLQELLRRLRAPLPSATVLCILAQSCMALQKAHDAQIIHRDIKPANLFLSRQENGEITVKILDFGIAKFKGPHAEAPVDKSLTNTGCLLGSPPYMSPEQAEGMRPVDARTDIWSLGVVGYELLSLKTPYDDVDSLGLILNAILSKAPRPVRQAAPWIPHDVAKLVQRALTRDPERRFSSATAMLEAIDHVAPVPCRLTESMLRGLSPEEQRYTSYRGSMIGVASLAIAAVVGFALSFGFSKDPQASSALASPSTGSLAPTVAAVVLPPAAGARPTSSSEIIGVLLPNSAPSAPEPPRTPPAMQLRIAPADAVVDVDGHRTEVVGGLVAIQGRPGSSHTVRLRVGNRELRRDIVLSETGPVPGRLDLASAPAIAPPPQPTTPRQIEVKAPPAAESAKPASSSVDGVEREYQ